MKADRVIGACLILGLTGLLIWGVVGMRRARESLVRSKPGAVSGWRWFKLCRARPFSTGDLTKSVRMLRERLTFAPPHGAEWARCHLPRRPGHPTGAGLGIRQVHHVRNHVWSDPSLPLRDLAVPGRHNRPLDYLRHGFLWLDSLVRRPGPSDRARPLPGREVVG